MSNVTDQIEAKFTEFRSETKILITEMKNAIMSEIKVLLSTQSETIAKLNTLIVQHESTISILRNDIDVLLEEKSALHKRCDEMEAKIERCNVAFDQKLESLEQYTRRQSLRIDGIKLNEVTDPD